MQVLQLQIRMARESQLLDFFAGCAFIDEATQFGFMLGKGRPGFLDAFGKRAFGVAGVGKELVAIVEQLLRTLDGNPYDSLRDDTKELLDDCYKFLAYPCPAMRSPPNAPS